MGRERSSNKATSRKYGVCRSASGTLCGKMVLPVWIEHTTSPLPRECSTTELRQRRHFQGPRPEAAGRGLTDCPSADNGSATRLEQALIASKPPVRCGWHWP